MRRYFFIGLIAVTIAIGCGTTLGLRVAADQSLSSLRVDVPTTTDARHPVAVFFVPPFLRTQAEMLTALKISVESEDRLEFQPGAELGIGGMLVVRRALPITIRDANTPQLYRTWATTVEELLSEQHIEIGDKDRVEPARETELQLDQTIMITRVSVTEVKKTESIAFTTKTQEDAERPRGQKEVVQKGVAGSKTLTSEVTRENGKEVGRKLVKSEVTKEPIEEVVILGTKVTVLGQGKATWYKTPWGGLTAAHNTLPKGTMVEVVNLKNGKRVTVRINDRGIQGDAIIDLSSDAFKALEPLGTGVIPVRLELAN